MAFFKSNTKGVVFSIEALRGGRKHAAIAGWDAGQRADSFKSVLRSLLLKKVRGNVGAMQPRNAFARGPQAGPLEV